MHQGQLATAHADEEPPRHSGGGRNPKVRRKPVAISLRNRGTSVASLWQARCKWLLGPEPPAMGSHRMQQFSTLSTESAVGRTLASPVAAPHPVRQGRSSPRHVVPFRPVFVYMCALFGPFVYREVPSSPIAQLRSGTNGAGWNNYWEISPSAGRPAWC